jgi:hypothetical protein
MEKRSISNKWLGPMNRISITQGLRLLNKLNAASVLTCRPDVFPFIAWLNDDADFVDTGFGDFLKDQFQGCSLDTLSIDEPL